jgi:hypothetical protein
MDPYEKKNSDMNETVTPPALADLPKETFDIQARQEGSQEPRQEVVPSEWKHKNLILIIAGILLVPAIFLGGGMTSVDGESVMRERTSTAVEAGKALFKEEVNANIQAQDFEVTGLTDPSGSAKMLIWDYNLEDKDEVQIFVDGKPIHNSFVLTKSPAAFSVPVPSVITIKGIKDNGGGISYAVKFPQNKLAYFNVVTVNGVNTYTLVPTP